MSIEKLSAAWPEWKVDKLLGEGSFGKVYKIRREEYGISSDAAVKVITIPQNDAEVASIHSEGLGDNGTRSYFEGIVVDFVNEIKLMQSMKGTSNIVSVEDYKVIENTDKIGWDIFIRMELLTPFNDYIADKALTEAEIIKLGQDVCTALELCAKQNIIHRDIKPENIFVSSFGDFKVGDFGIARELEKTSGAMSHKGTYNYMAPEVSSSKHYDATVDIYSLGLVLYKLLNNNRLPFLDPNAPLIQYQERKNAIDRRFSGEKLPPPVNASTEMAHVISIACAFKPEERFQSPTAFKNAMGTISSKEPHTTTTENAAEPIDFDETVEIRRTPVDFDETIAARRAPKSAEPAPEKTPVPIATFGKLKLKEKKKPFILAACVLLLAIIVVVVFTMNATDDPADAEMDDGDQILYVDELPPEPLEEELEEEEPQAVETIRIPDFTGYTYLELSQNEQYESLFTFYTTEDFSDVVISGGIIGQFPSAHSELEVSPSGEKIIVDLIVSLGSRQPLEPIDALSEAIFNTRDWVELNVFWQGDRRTVFERDRGSEVWTMLSRDGNFRMVDPIFSRDGNVFNIAFHTTSNVYNFFNDGTGSFDQAFNWEINTDPHFSLDTSWGSNQTDNLSGILSRFQIVTIRVFWDNGQFAYFYRAGNGSWMMRGRQGGLTGVSLSFSNTRNGVIMTRGSEVYTLNDGGSGTFGDENIRWSFCFTD